MRLSPSPRRRKMLFTFEQSTIMMQYEGMKGGSLGRRVVINNYLMNDFEADDYHIWRIKLELAKEGSTQALEEIKGQIGAHADSQHRFMQANMAQLLDGSTIHMLDKDKVYATYQTRESVPCFLLLMGKVKLRCVNAQGDSDTLCQVQKGGILELDTRQLLLKYGQSKASLLTQFQIVSEEKSILIELSPKSASQPAVEKGQTLTLREEAIMRKYMLIALKHITKYTYSKGMTVANKFYLLNGRACYYNNRNKVILACYQEGFFSPTFMENTEISLYIFQGAYLMEMEEDMLREEVIIGLQSKRKSHLLSIKASYDKMPNQQRAKYQDLLIKKYSLPRKELQKEILGLVPLQPPKKQKTESTRNSSRLKEKCNIRIRKSQRSK